jgi:hypothetical protein
MPGPQDAAQREPLPAAGAIPPQFSTVTTRGTAVQLTKKGKKKSLAKLKQKTAANSTRSPIAKTATKAKAAKKGKPFFSRSNNQNSARVQKKTADYLMSLPDHGLQPDLLAAVKTMQKSGKAPLSKLKLDMAHEIASSSMAEVILKAAEEGPKADATKQKIVQKAFEEVISSDEEDNAKATHRKNIRLALTAPKREDRMKYAKIVHARANRTSRNLRPGHASTNRSIQDHLDIHPVRVKIANKLSLQIRPRTRKNLGNFNAARKKLGLSPLAPRRATGGHVMSSSAGKTAGTALVHLPEL